MARCSFPFMGVWRGTDMESIVRGHHSGIHRRRFVRAADGPAGIYRAVITLQWTASPGVSSYQLEMGTASGLANAFNGNVGPTTVVQFNRAGVPSGVYFVRVKAVGSCGTSGASNEVTLDLR